MRLSPWILCLWPGLPSLWLQGRLSALIAAIGFAVLFQVALLTSFVWSGLATSGIRVIEWLAVGGVWFASAAISFRRLRCRLGHGSRESTDALFREAQSEYLKGNWYQVEALLERVLRYDSGDVDAHLMLATLYRHVRRTGEAKGCLGKLRQYELCGKWSLEMETEYQRLEEIESKETNHDSAAEVAVDHPKAA